MRAAAKHDVDDHARRDRCTGAALHGAKDDKEREHLSLIAPPS
jgi:hypothetical protein